MCKMSFLKNLHIVGIVICSMAYLNVLSSQDTKSFSLLENDRKKKGKMKGKGNKRKKEDLQEVDGEIEAVLQKKGEICVVVLMFALRVESRYSKLNEGRFVC